MSLDFNSQQVIIIGNVGGDPELRYTPQGIAVCSFSVGVNTSKGKGEQRTQETTWFKVTVWREKAETASNYIKKGSLLLVTGTVKASAYTDKQGKPAASLELTCEGFKFLGGKSDNSNPAPSENNLEDDFQNPDDIPF